MWGGGGGGGGRRSRGDAGKLEYAWAAHPRETCARFRPAGVWKLALERNARRATHNAATHSSGWQANGDASSLLLRSDPDDSGHAEIARVCKCVLLYGRKGADVPKIQRQIRDDAVFWVDEGAIPRRYAQIS